MVTVYLLARFVSKDQLEATTAVIAFSLDRIVRGRGFASQLLELGLLELARLWARI